MASLLQVCQDLRDGVTAADVGSLHPYATVPDQVVLPAVVFGPASPFAEYRTRMGASTVAQWLLLATVVVGRINEQAAHEVLYGYLSPGSPLIAAINATRTAVIRSATVTAGVRYGRFSFGSGEYLGAQLAVEIIA